MMDNNQVELAAKDVFVLMDVHKPNLLDLENKYPVTYGLKDDENSSKISLDSSEQAIIDVCNVFCFDT